jgi:SNF2 family DNA or RNA helicase
MITLMKHQQEWRRQLLANPRRAWFADPGCGKTIGMLAGIEALNARDGQKRNTVLAPLSILESAWLRDAQHFPGLHAAVLRGTPAQRKKIIAGSTWQTIITNYDTFKAERATLLAAGCKRLIVDESSKLKNPESKLCAAAWDFADKMDNVYLLCGTPAPNNHTEYWGQLRCLGKGVGTNTWHEWAHRYGSPCYEERWIPGRGMTEVLKGWKQSPKQRETMIAVLNNWSWTLRKEDCLDLPRKQSIIIPVPLDDEAEVYKRLKKDNYLIVRSDTGVEHKERVRDEASLNKCRQVTSGIVLFDGEAVKFGIAKITRLDELLDELGPEPVVIWAEFTAEIDAIVALCKKRGESVATIDGRTSGKAGTTAAEFQAGNTLRLVCHAASAGHGITLTAARYAVYYSMSFSYEQYQQSRDRLHRVGQTRACTYFHFLATLPEGSQKARETVDWSCYRVCAKKGRVAEETKAALVGEPRPVDFAALPSAEDFDDEGGGEGSGDDVDVSTGEVRGVHGEALVVPGLMLRM